MNWSQKQLISLVDMISNDMCSAIDNIFVAIMRDPRIEGKFGNQVVEKMHIIGIIHTNASDWDW